jgi:hypothetical protein
MALHCAFEMFEGSSDMELISEAARVLSPGGRMVILPLYMNNEHLFWAHPIANHRALDTGGMTRYWRTDAPISVPGIRFSREYSVDALWSRLIEPLRTMSMTLYFAENTHELDATCYCRLVAVFERHRAQVMALERPDASGSD